MKQKEIKDQLKAKNYRPTILTNCLVEIYTTFVRNVVKENCKIRKLFGKTQTAYKKHRCTTDKLIKPTELVIKPSSGPK